MKKALITLSLVASMSFGTSALADEAINGPVMMTDSQMSEIVAGSFDVTAPDYADTACPLDCARDTDISATYGLANADANGGSYGVTGWFNSGINPPQGRGI